jgi:hypothetical protein
VAVGGEAVMEAGLSTGRVSAEGGRWPPDPAATGDRGGGRRQGRAREGGPSVTFLFFWFFGRLGDGGGYMFGDKIANRHTGRKV